MSLYDKLKSGKFVMSGPCVIESEAIIMEIAETVKKLSEKMNFTYIFKASFDKANRTSINSFRGPGMEEGLKILQKVKDTFELPVVTDIHEPNQAFPAAEVADILQIPAFLCRQTDLLVSAAKTGVIVNIKKAQFLDGSDMFYPAQKIVDSGNNKILLTDRGTIFGLGRLVVDFTQMVDMKKMGYPVVMDVTHSTQRPGGGATSGGKPEYAPYIAKAAAAVGTDGFFFEVHPDPAKALSDGSNMLKLSDFEEVLSQVFAVYDVVR